jgi:hypothetical protein
MERQKTQFLRRVDDESSIVFSYDDANPDSDVTVLLWNEHIDGERYLYNIDTINLVNKIPIIVSRTMARQIWKKLISKGWCR